MGYKDWAFKKTLYEVLTNLCGSTKRINITASDAPLHGDYTTNVAFALSKQLKKSPMEVANNIKKALENDTSLHSFVDHIDVAAPGFVNITLKDDVLAKNAVDCATEKNGKEKTGKTIMIEFAHPNTHKQFHIGHLRNITTGECMVRLLEAAGNKVIRANYQGDVGLHIAKALYGITSIKNYELRIKNLADIQEKIKFLGDAYVAGNKAYEENKEAKKEIEEINKKIYAKDPSIYDLYKETRQWSLDYFETIYKRVGSHFDRYYFEGETYEPGKKLVLEGVKKGIFEKSDGAIIFPGEKFGLHNRVFITGEGNATYEAKDIGLSKIQFEEFHPDQIVHCVASEQIGYFQVIFEAIAQMFPKTKGKEHHLVYGWVRLKEGKMSSRSGNVVLGEWLLDEAKKEITAILNDINPDYTSKEKEDIAEKCAIAAVKYSFLKVGTIQDIAFDFKESVNIEGDSGPYLLYTVARGKSVIRKAKFIVHSSEFIVNTLNKEEREVARQLLYFPEVVQYAANQYAPNTLCSYLFQLAQAFNLLYAKHQIIGSDLRLTSTQAVVNVLTRGLYLLGIETVEKM